MAAKGRYADGPSIRIGRSRGRERPVDDRRVSPAVPRQSRPAASRTWSPRPAVRATSDREGPSATMLTSSTSPENRGSAARVASWPRIETRHSPPAEASAGLAATAASKARARALPHLGRSEEITSYLHLSLNTKIVIDPDIEDDADEIATRRQNGGVRNLGHENPARHWVSDHSGTRNDRGRQRLASSGSHEFQA